VQGGVFGLAGVVFGFLRGGKGEWVMRLGFVNQNGEVEDPIACSS
jgi:hypothetical protein